MKIVRMDPDAFRKHTEAVLREMEIAKTLILKVGLPEGTGAYPNGESILKVGATHEFGATFTHPGGTPYYVDSGMGSSGARFVSKAEGAGLPVTKAHQITIPRRSFLREPFRIHEDRLRAALDKQLRKIMDGQSARKGLELVGVEAKSISQGAFTTRGYGTWEDIKDATKKRKGSSQVLIDDSFLVGSITWEVSDATADGGVNVG